MKSIKQTKHGDYEWIVTFPVFSNYRVHIIFSGSISGSMKSRFGSTASDMFADAFHRYSAAGHSYLFYDIENCSMSTLVHEVVHAINALLVKWVGMDDIDDEIFAYHIGYLTGVASDFRNSLIDSGLGVKSEAEVQMNEKSSAA